ncbi:MAG: CSLREA domain-containing protein [Acidobacteriota bacterium]
MVGSTRVISALATVTTLGALALAAEPSRVSLARGVSLAPAAGVAGSTVNSLLRADLDRDGRAELIAAYRAPQGGAVAIYHQDHSGRYQDQVQVFTLLARPDFLAAIDADADGNLDLVAGTRGSAVLEVLVGDGRGWLQQARPVVLGGALSAMAAADVDRDSVGEVAVAIESSVQLLSSTRGIMAASPIEIARADSNVNALLFAQLDNGFALDLALATDRSVSVVRGNEQNFSGAAISSTLLESAVGSITAASFVPGRPAQLAVLTGDGLVQLFDARSGLREERRLAVGTTASKLTSGKFSSGDGSDLVVLGDNWLRLIAGGHDFGFTATDLPQRGRPLDALAAPSTNGGLSDLVLALDDAGAPVISAQGNDAAFVVTSTADTADAVIDGVCDDGAGNCTLRAAIQEANAAIGADTITFNLGAGTPTITLATAMVQIVDTVDINGNTGGSTRVELNGNSITQPPIFLAVGSSGSAIRGLVINRAGTATTGAPGIRIESGSNLVENCYIGTDNAGGSTVAQNRGGGVIITGTAATGNTIGGTTAAQRNLISRNSLDGVLIVRAPPATGCSAIHRRRCHRQCRSGEQPDGSQCHRRSAEQPDRRRHRDAGNSSGQCPGRQQHEFDCVQRQHRQRKHRARQHHGTARRRHRHHLQLG